MEDGMEALSALERQNLATLNLSQVIRPQVSGGKIALPVNHFSVYAQFKHIEAVPASGGAGYPISKVRILDILIDRLVQLKDKNSIERAPKDSSKLSDQAIDALIQEYSQRLHTAMNTGLPKLQAQFGSNFAASGGSASAASG